jgi:hypothetical protein
MRLFLLSLIIGVCLCLSIPANADDSIRLSDLSAKIIPAASCRLGCWRITELNIEYSNAIENINVTLENIPLSTKLNLPGWTVIGAPQEVFVPYTQTVNKPRLEYCYSPAIGSGPYTIYAGQDKTKSDSISGIGLPYCENIRVQIVFQWTGSYYLHLPIVR